MANNFEAAIYYYCSSMQCINHDSKQIICAIYRLFVENTKEEVIYTDKKETFINRSGCKNKRLWH